MKYAKDLDIKELIIAAHNGDLDCKHELALRYYNANGVEKTMINASNS